MYAVIADGRLAFLGHCRGKAFKAFEDKTNASLIEVADLDELKTALDVIETDPLLDDEDEEVDLEEVDLEEVDLEEAIEELLNDPEVSKAFKAVAAKLDSVGVNKDLVNKIKDNGGKLVGEVKSLGARGMAAVGEGFVALGDLLRKNEKKEGCGKPDCCQHEPKN